MELGTMIVAILRRIPRLYTCARTGRSTTTAGALVREGPGTAQRRVSVGGEQGVACPRRQHGAEHWMKADKVSDLILVIYPKSRASQSQLQQATAQADAVVKGLAEQQHRCR